jgi:[ribosomal protein S18]-alanine N-acetyltransferase
MITQVNTQVRKATSTDKQKIANLIHFGTFVHRHLDWHNPLDWINQQPFVILERGNNILATLACPPDPPEISWIRLFAADVAIPIDEAWKAVWDQSLRQLTEKNVRKVVVIPLHDWLLGLVYRNGFKATIRVITMIWKSQFLPPPKRINSMVIRPMTVGDIEDIASLDAAAFNPLWCNSRSSIEIAFRQAAIASVVDLNGIIAGYQISTSNQMGGHLARLAIHPQFQGSGIGYSLLYELLTQFDRRRARQVSVNTQEDNSISLYLYEKAGFVRTGEEYQVFELDLSSG